MCVFVRFFSCRFWIQIFMFFRVYHLFGAAYLFLRAG